jgi:uncharacterized protein
MSYPPIQAAATQSALNQKLLLKMSSGDVRSITNCLDAGASINVRDSRGYTPLMIAAELGFSNIVNLLLTRQAAVDAPSSDGCTALHHAVEKGCLLSVKQDRKSVV